MTDADLIERAVDSARLARAMQTARARLAAVALAGDRSVLGDLCAFAEGYARDRADAITDLAVTTVPTDSEERTVRAVSDQAARVTQTADALDVAGAERAQAAAGRARNRLAGALATAPQGHWGSAFLTALGLARDATPSRPQIPAVSRDVLDDIEAAGADLARSRVLAALAEALLERVSIARNANDRRRERQAAIDRAVDRLRAEYASRVPEPRDLLPFDLVLDAELNARRLVDAAPPIDWALAADRLGDATDDASADLAVRSVLADRVHEITRLPFEVLLPRLADRSVSYAFDGFVRDGGPLAPLRPGEVTDRFTGLKIGTVEARDAGVARGLVDALRRAGDVAVEAVQAPSLPDGVRARVVRFGGVLSIEALHEVVVDLTERAGTAQAEPATRDWVVQLPPLVTEARMRREVAARKLRGESTRLLDPHLPSDQPPAGPVPEAK